MEGKVTVTDKKGGVIFKGDIWMVLVLCVFSGKWNMDPNGVRIFIDGDEIPKPAVFESATQERG